jgi:hypothetical protein
VRHGRYLDVSVELGTGAGNHRHDAKKYREYKKLSHFSGTLKLRLKQIGNLIIIRACGWRNGCDYAVQRFDFKSQLKRLQRSDSLVGWRGGCYRWRRFSRITTTTAARTTMMSGGVEKTKKKAITGGLTLRK